MIALGGALVARPGAGAENRGMRRGVAFAAFGVVALGGVALGGGRAGAQGVSAGELRQAVFPQAHGATRELGVRDEENRPLFLAAFEWARWPKLAPVTYVALAVVTTVRGVGPGVGCDRQRAAVPGGVMLAVVRREQVRVKRKTTTKLKVVGHDALPVTLGCDDGTATDAITLDVGPYRLSDAEQAVAVRRRRTFPTGSNEEIRLYRFAGEVRAVLLTDVPVRDRERQYQVTLEPAKTRAKGFFDVVQRITPRPLPRPVAPASAPAPPPASQRARPAPPPASQRARPAPPPASQRARPWTTTYRWTGTHYEPR
jgi:hypothetical protein